LTALLAYTVCIPTVAEYTGLDSWLD